MKLAQFIHRDLFWLVVLVVAVCGCGSGNARLINDLKGVGVYYQNYHDTFQRGPANWDDLAKAGWDKEQVQRVRDAGYEVKWGVKFKEVPGSTSNKVLAERPGGGPKLMMDGSVQR